MTGATPQAHVMDSLAAPKLGTTVMERVLASIKPGARTAIPAFRVRVALVQPVSVSVEPSVTPRIKIGVNGEVLQVDLGAGTGYPDGDRSLRQSLESQRYEPALLDGRPVQVWLRGKSVELVR